MAVPGGILKPPNQPPKKGRQITFADSTTVPKDMTIARQSTNGVAIQCFKPPSEVNKHRPLPQSPSTSKKLGGPTRQNPSVSNKEKTKPR